jgi:hypothetical protein
MLKLRSLVICPFLLLGCSSQPPAPTVTVISPPTESTSVYEPIASERLYLHAAPPSPKIYPPKAYAPKAAESKDSYAMMGEGGGGAATSPPKVYAELQIKPNKKSKKSAKAAFVKPTASAPTPVVQDDVMIQLSQAAIAFNVPNKTINIDESFDIQLAIDPSKVAAELGKTISKEGTVVSNTLLISKIVRVQIVAPDFTISTTTTEEQAISKIAPTIWEWTLKPNEVGKRTIKVTVTATVFINGKKVPRHISTFEQYITVDITADQVLVRWFKQYWQWLISTLLIPLAIYGWKKYKTPSQPKLPE